MPKIDLDNWDPSRAKNCSNYTEQQAGIIKIVAVLESGCNLAEKLLEIPRGCPLTLSL